MQVNGSVLRSRFLFVRSFGDRQVDQFLAALSSDTRALVDAGFLETRWYPFEALVEMMEVADRVLGSGDMSLCQEMGRFSADKNLSTLYRLFFKFGSINWILDRAAKAWRAQYDEGRIEIAERGQRSVTVDLLDVPEPHQGHCLAVMGWMIRAGELSGEELESVQQECRARGDSRCRWVFTWR